MLSQEETLYRSAGREQRADWQWVINVLSLLWKNKCADQCCAGPYCCHITSLLGSNLLFTLMPFIFFGIATFSLIEYLCFRLICPRTFHRIILLCSTHASKIPADSFVSFCGSCLFCFNNEFFKKRHLHSLIASSILFQKLSLNQKSNGYVQTKS